MKKWYLSGISDRWGAGHFRLRGEVPPYMVHPILSCPILPTPHVTSLKLTIGHLFTREGKKGLVLSWFWGGGTCTGGRVGRGVLTAVFRWRSWCRIAQTSFEGRPFKNYFSPDTSSTKTFSWVQIFFSLLSFPILYPCPVLSIPRRAEGVQGWGYRRFRHHFCMCAFF